MATAQTVQTPSNKVTIRFNKSLLACIGEMLALRSMSIENYLIQLAEADVALIRLGKFHTDFPLPKRGEAKIIETRGISRPKLSPSATQRAIFLYDVERLSAETIARRFGVSEGTIHRILRQREQTDIHVPAVTRRTNSQRWEERVRGAEAKIQGRTQ